MLEDELEKLRLLHQEGNLTADEYEAAVQQLLKQPKPSSAQLSSRSIQPSGHARNDSSRNTGKSTELLGMTPKDYITLMHLSQYSGFVIPFGGTLAPIVLYLIGRDSDSNVEEHGREVVNWVISSMIYCIVSFVFSFVLIGIPFLVFFLILVAFLPLIGALSFKIDKPYHYPLTIRFITE